MRIKTKPVLTSIGGILILLAPITVQMPIKLFVPAPADSGSAEVKGKDYRLNKGNSQMRGLYGFWYGGF